VFTGGGTLDAVEAVCATGTPVLAGLSSLLASNLLRMPAAPATSGGPRVSMLETNREYGSEQLQARAEAGAARRHAGWYLALAEEAAPALAGPDAAAWLARLDDEHDNLRAALALPGGGGADTPSVRVNCLVAACRLAIGQAAYGEAEALAGEVATLAREHGDPAELAAVHNTGTEGKGQS